MLIDEARGKIKTTQLINRLQNHALGTVDLSPTQVRAVEILLKKCVPDVSAVTVGGDPNNPVQHMVEIRTALHAKFDRIVGNRDSED